MSNMVKSPKKSSCTGELNATLVFLLTCPYFGVSSSTVQAALQESMMVRVITDFHVILKLCVYSFVSTVWQHSCNHWAPHTYLVKQRQVVDLSPPTLPWWEGEEGRRLRKLYPGLMTILKVVYWDVSKASINYLILYSFFLPWAGWLHLDAKVHPHRSLPLPPVPHCPHHWLRDALRQGPAAWGTFCVAVNTSNPGCMDFI